MPKKGHGRDLVPDLAPESAITDRLLELARILGRNLARQHAADANAGHKPKPDPKTLDRDR